MIAISPKALSNEAAAPLRHWLANIDLSYEYRRARSSLVKVEHKGPLRVQRPFYPEPDGTCHTYLLHPPGGMAVGDTINIHADLDRDTSVLLTTPSAGKMYGSLGVAAAEKMPQIQSVDLCCNENTSLEWLPQETIIFDRAQAHLNTDVYLSASSKFIGWDVVRLGRAASGERFESGFCKQRLQCFREGRLIFRELNKFSAGSDMMNAVWGLQGKNTLATMLATAELDREQVDHLYTLLPVNSESAWALTQKQDIFIARYLGSSILDCRKGLLVLWKTIRPLVMNKAAVEPRIWNT